MLSNNRKTIKNKFKGLTSSICAGMPSKNFQGNNKRILIKIRVNHAMKNICSTIIRACCKERV